jgi:precorrin-6B methylase 1
MDPEAIAFELERGKSVFLISDEKTDLEGLCRYLESHGLSRSVAAMTDLGYPQERISRGSTATPPQAPGLSCIFIGDL